MKEQWIKWEPLQVLSTKYFIISIVNDCDGFKIILGDDCDNTKKDIHITFADGVDAYRETDISYRLKAINTINKNYGNWTFFKVINSKYVQWLADESYNISKPLQFIHFSFITTRSILDIISPIEPLIEFANQSDSNE